MNDMSNSKMLRLRILAPYVNFRHRRRLRRLFDETWYSRRYNINDHPFRHYMTYGFKELNEPNQYFDSSWYVSSALKRGYRVRNPLSHYVAIGSYLNISPSPYFDPDWYYKRYPDVAAERYDPFLHFITHGTVELRSPNPSFDASWYAKLAKLKTGDESPQQSPLLHYLSVGENNGLRPSPYFDPVWYLNHHKDVANAGVRPLHHYLHHGRAEGRYTCDHYIASQLFDEDWYRAATPDVDFDEVSPFQHYIETGYRDDREPCPLFDSQWYIEQAKTLNIAVNNPLLSFCDDGIAHGLIPSPYIDNEWYYAQINSDTDQYNNAFIHFLQFGMKDNKDPNPFFDTAWYIEQNDLSDSLRSLPPLLHYIEEGESRGLKPSPHFDPNWYKRFNPDVRKSGISPLKHFLAYGRHEGREGSSDLSTATDVFDADLTRVTLNDHLAETMLLVTHSADGNLKPHVIEYISSVACLDISVILIVASDVEPTFLDMAHSIPGVSAIYIRRNIGFDFAAWAHILRTDPSLLQCDILYLSNDSVIGPISRTDFSSVINRIRLETADIIGLTDNYEITWHLQSYFIAFKNTALTSTTFTRFFHDIKNLHTKRQVIQTYEITFAQKFIDGGLRCKALFPAPTPVEQNQTIFRWRELIEEGFPFVKVATLRDSYLGVYVSDWRNVVSAYGYDTSVAESLLSANSAGMLVPDAENGIDEFDRDFYLSINLDVAQAGIDPYLHYVDFGRQEGRTASVPGMASFRGNVSRRKVPTVLVVSHEAVRGGAPILAYNLANDFLKTYNVVILYLGGGDLVDASAQAGCETIGPISLGAPAAATYVIDKIASLRNLKFALANTVESRYILKPLAQNCIPVIALIHEFASYVKPREAIPYVVRWASKTVFSTEMTAQSARDVNPEISNIRFPIIPQGLSLPPSPPRAKQFGSVSGAGHPKIRPPSFPADAMIVLGAGFIEYRKGPDLFVHCAATLKRRFPDMPFRFVWMGRGYLPNDDLYSSILADQVRRSDLEDIVYFIGEIEDVVSAYMTADILLLTSRLDPLPNVTVEALSFGLPVVCFENTSGVADVLTNNDLGKFCIAEYLNVFDLAEKVEFLYKNPLIRHEISVKSKEIGRNVFSFSKYIRSLEDLVDDIVNETKIVTHAISVIFDSGKFDRSYYIGVRQTDDKDDTLIHEYVRNSLAGIERRKLFPGFHPGIYSELKRCAEKREEPTASYIAEGAPRGPWSSKLIKSSFVNIGHFASRQRVALHIHCFYTELLKDILERIAANAIRPELFISVPNLTSATFVRRMVYDVLACDATIEVVPNRGRDLAPFFLTFGSKLISEFDIIGHVHTKMSFDTLQRRAIDVWRRFLMENVIGGQFSMMDSIISEINASDNVGIVFPDDPHEIGWGGNRQFAAELWSRVTSEPLPDSIWFPVGSMFWAKRAALAPLFEMRLQWSDFPEEPLRSDGSALHALERLFGLSALHAGFEIGTTYCVGVSR